MQSPSGERRSSMWTYYDRRVAYREATACNVLNYFLGLGADDNLDAINDELLDVNRCLESSRR